MNGTEVDYFTPERLMRTWEQDGFKIELFETHEKMDASHEKVAYRFYDTEWADGATADVPIFEGADLGIAAHAIDDLRTVNALCGFLGLRPGDTDDEFFADYTNKQIDWRDARAEELSLWGDDDIDMETGQLGEDA